MDSLFDGTDVTQPEQACEARNQKVVLLPVSKRHSAETPLAPSPERMAELLQNAGYKGYVIEDEYRRFVESSAEGWKFRVYFYGEHAKDTGDRFNSFMFTSGWSLQQEDIANALNSANIFNVRFRYLKAYVVSGDDYAYTEAEMSQFCPDGVSDYQFISFLEMFINLRQSYVTIFRETGK
jgi:hypothetical protein